MDIQELIRVYEKRQRATEAALRAGQEYNKAAHEFMAELRSSDANIPHLGLQEEMLAYIHDSAGRIETWIVRLDLEDWKVVGLRKIAVLDLDNGQRDRENEARTDRLARLVNA